MGIIIKVLVLIFMMVLIGKTDGDASMFGPRNYCYSQQKWPVITNDECLEYKMDIAMASKKELAFKVSSVSNQINGNITFEIWINNCHALDIKRDQRSESMFEVDASTNSSTSETSKYINNKEINFEWQNHNTVFAISPDNSYNTSLKLECPLSYQMEKMNGVEQKFVTMGIRYSRDEPQITVEFSSDMYLDYVSNVSIGNHLLKENISDLTNSGKHSEMEWMMPLITLFGTLLKIVYIY